MGGTKTSLRGVWTQPSSRPAQLLWSGPSLQEQAVTRAEMIAAALYTGPMFVVYNGIPCRFPKELCEVFVEKDNLLSVFFGRHLRPCVCLRCKSCPDVCASPPGMVLYRGLTCSFPTRSPTRTKTAAMGTTANLVSCQQPKPSRRFR